MLQEGSFLVRTHHVEYCDGGILDPDDVLSDLVEDKDKVRISWDIIEHFVLVFLLEILFLLKYFLLTFLPLLQKH